MASVLGLVSRLEAPIQYSVDWGSDLVLQMVAPLLSPVASHNSTFSEESKLAPIHAVEDAIWNNFDLAPANDCGVNPSVPSNTLLPTLVDV